MGVPPALIRDLLRGAGLRPATLAKPLDAFSPWASYAALRIERDWFQADSRDVEARLEAEGRRRFGHEPDPEEVAAFRAWAMAELPLPDGPQLELAERVASGGGMPGSLAIADEFEDPWRQELSDVADPRLYFEVLTGPGWADHARSQVAQVLCRAPIELTAADEDVLIRAIPLYDDRGIAISAAMIGLRAAVARGNDERVGTFRDLLDDAFRSCDEWGQYGDFAGEFPPFDQLPPELGPVGFAERAKLLGQSLVDVATVTSDCARVPCMATVSYLPGVPWEAATRAESRAAELWPGARLATQLGGDDDAPGRTVLVPVVGSWSRHQLGRIADWRVGSGHFACLQDTELRELRAELGEPAIDWEGGLSAAAYACHRDDPLTDRLGAPGRWDGQRWHLGGTSPFLRCVEARFDGPAPQDGTTIAVWFSIR